MKILSLPVGFALGLTLAILSAHGADQVTAPMPSDNDAQTLSSMGEIAITPLAGNVTTAETTDLVAAINTYQSGKDPEDFSPLEKFLQKYPFSAYRAGLLVNLSQLAYHYGYYSKALNDYKIAWNIGMATPIPKSPSEEKIVADAGLQLARLYARLGHRTDLEGLLTNLKPYPLWGPSAFLYDHAMQAASRMEHMPGKAYNCGPYALLTVANYDPQLQANTTVFTTAKATPDQGFTVAQLAQLAQDAGMSYKAARRTNLTELPLPAVVHWTIGHYAAVLKKEGDRYLVRDRTFGTDFWMSAKALNEESSGVFLIPVNSGGQLPDGWQTASESDLRLAGKGVYSVQNEDDQPSSADDINYDPTDNDADPSLLFIGLDCSKHGMTRVGFSTFEGKATLTDTPLHFVPPKGPPVAFTISYYAGEQPNQVPTGTTTIGDPGNSTWTMNYLNPATLSDTADNQMTVLTSKATKLTYSYLDTANLTLGNYTGNLNIFTGDIMENVTSGGGFIQHAPDGSSVTFSQNVTASGGLHQYMPTAVTDAQGNSLTFTYGNLTYPYRLTSLSDAVGNTYTMVYGNMTHPFWLTGIDSSFGNVALSYDSYGRLLSITDPASIISSFTYGNATTPGAVTTLTTPYGNTTIMAENTSYPIDGYMHMLLITDPTGAQNFVLAGDPLYNLGMSNGWANTLYFNKRAMSLLSEKLGSVTNWPWPSTPVYYSWLNSNDTDGLPYFYYGTTYVWNFLLSTSGLSTGVPEAIIQPAQHGYGGNAEISAYAYNTDNSGYPILSQPTAVQSGTHFTQYTYGNFGEPLTQTTSVTDNGQTGINLTQLGISGNTADIENYDPLPLNSGYVLDSYRKTTFQYYSNEIDLENITVTDSSSGNIALAEFGSYTNHLPDSVTDAGGMITDYFYSSGLLTQAVKNATGNLVETTNYNRDGDGFLTSVTQSGPGITGNATLSSMTYSGGLLQSLTDAQGFTANYTYDPLQRVTSANYTDGTYEAWDYHASIESNSNVLALSLGSYRDRQGQTTTYSYDGDGHMLTATDSANRTVSYDWCGCGSLEGISFGSALSGFDSFSGLSPINYDYDLAGHLITKSVLGIGGAQVYSYAYDANGQMASVTLPNEQGGNATINYTYNIDGTVANITYNGTNAPAPVALSYDLTLGRLTSAIQGTGGSAAETDYSYGTSGASNLRLAFVNGPWSNDTLHYDYDELERVSDRKVLNDAGNVTFQSETYTYDGLDRVLSANNTLGNFTFAYSGNSSELASVAYPNGMNTSLGYLSANQGAWLGNITNNVTISGNTTLFSEHDYTHRSDGLITAWQQQFGWNPAVAANVSGSTQKQLYTYAYDGSDWMVTANLGAPANLTTLQDTYENWDYGYDNMGNPTSSSVNLAGWGAQYDSANELTQQTRSGPIRVAGYTNEPTNVTVGGLGVRRWSLPGGSPWMFESFQDLAANTSNISIVATDAVGNSTTQVWKIDANSTVSNFTYNNDGAMLTRVNNADSTTVDVSSNYTWDSLGRLLSYQQGNTTVSFTYDWQGRRVSLSANVSGNVTNQYFLWDGDSIFERRDGGTGSGNISRKYFDDGMVTVSGNTSTNYFYTKDHLGSIREVVANDGHTVDGRYDYGPWGETTYFDYSGGSAPQPDFGYAGYMQTPFVPGVYFTENRIYDPTLHRWLSRDPIGEAGGLNLYGYAKNDPIDQIDPLGLYNVLGLEFDDGKSFLANVGDYLRAAGISFKGGVDLGDGIGASNTVSTHCDDLTVASDLFLGNAKMFYAGAQFHFGSRDEPVSSLSLMDADGLALGLSLDFNRWGFPTGSDIFVGAGEGEEFKFEPPTLSTNLISVTIDENGNKTVSGPLRNVVDYITPYRYEW